MRSNRVKLYEVSSPISGRIEVWEEGVERKLIVGGTVQSIYRLDGSERGYWQSLVPKEKVDSVLLLGLGAGTVAKNIRKRWPGARIVGYELDPDVVRAARSFFDLDREVVVRVRDFREAFTDPEKFDLVVVDLYRGYNFLAEAETEEAIQQVKGKVKPGGWVAFNRVYVFTNGGQLQKFEERLRRIFQEVRLEKVNFNRIFWARA